KKPKTTKPAKDPFAVRAAGVKVAIQAGGVNVEVRPNSSEVGTFEMDCPARGKEGVFGLTNTTDKVLGVVLKVQGMDTIGERKEPAEQCGLWVIGPKQTLQFKGSSVGAKSAALKNFVVRAREEAKATDEELDDKLDLIQVYTFSAPADRVLRIPAGRIVRP